MKITMNTKNRITTVNYNGEKFTFSTLRDALIFITSRSENLCVACGEIIPEGRQICPKCEKSTR